MSRGYRGIACAGLTAAALCLLSAAPAAAFCSHPSTVYNSGLVTGTGITCADALHDLESNLQASADVNCMNIYGSGASYDITTYTETLNSCQPNGVGKQQSGSASYKCIVCT